MHIINTLLWQSGVHFYITLVLQCANMFKLMNFIADLGNAENIVQYINLGAIMLCTAFYGSVFLQSYTVDMFVGWGAIRGA